MPLRKGRRESRTCKWEGESVSSAAVGAGFLAVLGAGGPRARHGQVWFLPRPLSWACSHGLLPVASSPWPHLAIPCTSMS